MLMKRNYLFFIFIFLSFAVSGKGKNVALNAEIVASSSLNENHGASKAIDGDYYTFWETDDISTQQSLTLDLKDFFFLSKIEQTFKSKSVWMFKIEASTDESNWLTLVDMTKGAAGKVFGMSAQGLFRYIRLTIHGSNDNANPSSTEFKVIGSKIGYNLALGKNFINSTGQQYCEPEKAVDGDISSYWCAEDGTYPKSITLDLQHNSIITGVQQVFKDYDTWQYQIWGSKDLLQWDLLDNNSRVERLVETYSKVTGEYRYIKLTVLGSASGFWSNSCELKVFGYANEEEMNHDTFSATYNQSLTLDKYQWWKDKSGLIRYYTKLYENQLTDITDSLDILKAQGFNIIELMCPYKGDADIWAGLGATDNYDIDPSIGTMQDFEILLDEAHARDMKVLFFGNVGYCRDEAPFFQKACDDERNDVYSKERKWFSFSKTKLNDRWFWSDRAQAYYYSFWGNTDGANGRIPSYNFNNQEWRDECKKYLQFWADKGIDGLYLDAPEVYLGITDEIIKEYIVDVLNAYNGLSTNAEGSGDYRRWMGRFKFNCIQGFDMYGWGGGGRSQVLISKRSNDASSINNLMKGYRDQVTSMYGVTLTPPMWETYATIDERIFETAFLTTMGTLFANHCGDKQLVAQDIMKSWPASKQEEFHHLVSTQNSYIGLSPSGQRTALPTNSNKSFTVFKRTNDDGNVSALAIFNFYYQQRDISITLKNSGIQIPQVPLDLLTGFPAEPINTDKYTITLPAYGYKILGVENSYYDDEIPNELESIVNKPYCRVFPSIFDDEVNVASQNTIRIIYIYSVSGHLVRKFENIPANFTLKLEDLPQGVYVIRICDVENNVYLNKIVKQN